MPELDADRYKRLTHGQDYGRSDGLYYDSVSGALALVIDDVIVQTFSSSLGPVSQVEAWRDQLGPVVSPPTGPTIPPWTQMGASAFYGYAFAVNDQLWFAYHLQHDYKPDSDVYLHVHWTTNGTSVAVVRWQFTYLYAKGFNQEAYDIGGGGTVVPVNGTPSGTAWRHMTTEISSPISALSPEPDGIMLVNLKRVTNGGVDNGDTVFVTMADMHYQTDRHATPGRAPDFYT